MNSEPRQAGEAESVEERIISAVRQQFTPAVNRLLTTEIEPAMVYDPGPPTLGDIDSRHGS